MNVGLLVKNPPKLDGATQTPAGLSAKTPWSELFKNALFAILSVRPRDHSATRGALRNYPSRCCY